MSSVFPSSEPPADDRGNPHSQARAARAQPLLLHSLALFHEVFAAVFAHRMIRTVVEIGVESGQVSGMYSELGAQRVYCIEPHPSSALRNTISSNAALNLVERHSPDVLAELPAADLYVLDGDHNYATVRAELDWILAHAPDGVVVLHDVLWPWGRRDLYYQPTSLSSGVRHPDSSDGPTVWHDELTPAGFVGGGAYTAATQAGGEANGVLTAVEDALAAAPKSWCFTLVPAVFGLGVLIRADSPNAEGLRRSLEPYADSALLSAMENNRIALYTRVLQLQYEAAEYFQEADMLAERLGSQQRHIDRLTRQVHKAEQRHAADLDALSKTREQLVLAAQRPATLRGAAALTARTAMTTVRRRVRESSTAQRVGRAVRSKRR